MAQKEEVMKAHNILESMQRSPDCTYGKEASFWILQPFNGGNLWIGTYVGGSPWERHPDGDELIHMLEGEAEVTLLTDKGKVQAAVPAGSVYVIPRGVWHRHSAKKPVVQYGVTSGKTDHSDAEDPRMKG